MPDGLLEHVTAPLVMLEKDPHPGSPPVGARVGTTVSCCCMPSMPNISQRTELPGAPQLGGESFLTR